METVFVEQPLATLGSAKYVKHYQICSTKSYKNTQQVHNNTKKNSSTWLDPHPPSPFWLINFYEINNECFYQPVAPPDPQNGLFALYFGALPLAHLFLL